MPVSMPTLVEPVPPATALMGANLQLTPAARAWLREIILASELARFRPPIEYPRPQPSPWPYGDPMPQPNAFGTQLMGEMLVHQLEVADKVDTDWALAAAIKDSGIQKEVLSEVAELLDSGLKDVKRKIAKL